jgi:hypothetical protein
LQLLPILARFAGSGAQSGARAALSRNPSLSGDPFVALVEKVTRPRRRRGASARCEAALVHSPIMM